MIEHTLVIIKPDGVKRGIGFEVLSRLEKAGLKVVALKMVTSTLEQAKYHYTYEDIAVRHGEEIRNQLLKYISESPIIVTVFEGVEAIEIVRKLCGSTEPRKAPPGTIRGDYCHHSYALCEKTKVAVKNVVHASANKEDAKREIKVWFTPEEIYQYKRSDEYEHYCGYQND